MLNDILIPALLLLTTLFLFIVGLIVLILNLKHEYEMRVITGSFWVFQFSMTLFCLGGVVGFICYSIFTVVYDIYLVITCN